MYVFVIYYEIYVYLYLIEIDLGLLSTSLGDQINQQINKYS